MPPPEPQPSKLPTAAVDATKAAAEPLVRATFLANTWLGHQPRGVQRLPEALAARLLSAEAIDDAIDGPVRDRLPMKRRGAVPAVILDADADAETTSLQEAAVGYPFFHPPISMQSLPAPGAISQRHALSCM